MEDISNKQVDQIYDRLNKYAESHGYHLNPDIEFAKDLIKSLLLNQKRYGYWACPCRLASGKRKNDEDIICPCVYRDPDVKEFGVCYCALYVSKEIKDGKKQAASIPDRRPAKNKNLFGSNMKSLDAEIRFVKSWPEDEIVKLYKAGGWWRDSYNKSGIKNLIKGSFAFAVVIDKNTGKAIGMGRLLSDGVSDAYIQDLVILPEYRNCGLGQKLVKKLVDHCISKKIMWIGLIAEPNQDEFYLKLGFKQMEKYTPLKYHNEEQ